MVKLQLPELELADPYFGRPAKVDMVLGVGLMAELLGQHNKREGSFLLQESKLGWLVSGNGSGANQHRAAVVMAVADVELEPPWQKFWQM